MSEPKELVGDNGLAVGHKANGTRNHEEERRLQELRDQVEMVKAEDENRLAALKKSESE